MCVHLLMPSITELIIDSPGVACPVQSYADLGVWCAWGGDGNEDIRDGGGGCQSQHGGVGGGVWYGVVWYAPQLHLM